MSISKKSIKILWKIAKGILLIVISLSIVKLVSLFSFSLLRTFGYSLLVLTIGVILDSKETWYRKGIKYLLYIGYSVYTLWNLGVIENLAVLLDMDTLDYTTLMLGFIAPLCMMFVGKKVMAITIKGYKIFNYYTLWLIYLIIGFVWYYFYPEQIVIELLIIYCIITIVILSVFKSKKRGN